jgi:hypothetical protein
VLDLTLALGEEERYGYATIAERSFYAVERISTSTTEMDRTFFAARPY